MRFENAYVPVGGYWSSPFSKWQGSLSTLHPLRLAADVTKRALAARQMEPTAFDALVLGWTIPARRIFYGAPWFAGLVGAPALSGPMISQACATSAACVAHAAAAVDARGSEATLVVTTDKCSNGAHIVYPDPTGPGGKGESEDWVWDNFSLDPWAQNSMIQTAENVAKEAGITRAEVDALTIRRHAQYHEGVKSGFQSRYMVLPLEVNPSGRKVVATLEGDEGVFPTTAEGLARLKPVLPDGVITFGSQTHPADGTAGLVVATRERARELGGGREPVRVLSYGVARVEKGYMAKAVVPAARRALEGAGMEIGDVAVVKTHNPFAVNDVYFAREMGIDADGFNNLGSSLIFGHPQGPTGARLVAEGIEEARLKGGGHVLFAGCAAGDTAAALLFEVPAA
jgi:acetyl-CoA acetyltransferase